MQLKANQIYSQLHLYMNVLLGILEQEKFLQCILKLKSVGVLSITYATVLPFHIYPLNDYLLYQLVHLQLFSLTSLVIN